VRGAAATTVAGARARASDTLRVHGGGGGSGVGGDAVAAAETWLGGGGAAEAQWRAPAQQQREEWRVPAPAPALRAARPPPNLPPPGASFQPPACSPDPAVYFGALRAKARALAAANAPNLLRGEGLAGDPLFARPAGAEEEGWEAEEGGAQAAPAAAEAEAEAEADLDELYPVDGQQARRMPMREWGEGGARPAFSAFPGSKRPRSASPEVDWE